MSARATTTKSFIGTLKAEMLRSGSFTSHDDAQTEIFSYIEMFYNTRRKHSSLLYNSPSRFELVIATPK